MKTFRSILEVLTVLALPIIPFESVSQKNEMFCGFPVSSSQKFESLNHVVFLSLTQVVFIDVQFCVQGCGTF